MRRLPRGKYLLLDPFVEFVRKTISKHGLIAPRDRVLVALSGGPDSVASLWALYALSTAMEFSIGACHLDHGLRRNSAADEEFCRALTAKLKVPYYSQRANVRAIARTEKLSVEEAARNTRYRFLRETAVAGGYNVVATGHNADDNAETVLFNVLRGTGLNGLAGIPVSRAIGHGSAIRLVRPLIGARKAEILAFLDRFRIESVTDRSNLSQKYTRNRIRRAVLPAAVKAVGTDVVENINRLSEIAGEFRELLSIAVEESGALQIGPDKRPFMLARDLRELPAPLKRAALLELAANAGFNASSLSYKRFKELLAIAERTSGNADYPLDADYVLRNRRGEITFAVTESERAGQPRILRIPGTTTFENLRFETRHRKASKRTLETVRRNRDANTAYLDADKLAGEIQIRAAKHGDRFVPLGMKGKKKLSDFFIDEKLSPEDKKGTPVLECSGGIVWVAGLRIDDRFKVTEKTTKVLVVKLRK